MGYRKKNSASNVKTSGNCKKASLRKTYKNQTEANNKVWAVNRDPKRAVDTLALLNERFEQVNSDSAHVDKKFDKHYEEMEDDMEIVKQDQRVVEMASQAVHDSRTDDHRLAISFDQAEGALYEGLGVFAQFDCEDGGGCRGGRGTGARTRRSTCRMP